MCILLEKYNLFSFIVNIKDNFIDSRYKGGGQQKINYQRILEIECAPLMF